MKRRKTKKKQRIIHNNQCSLAELSVIWFNSEGAIQMSCLSVCGAPRAVVKYRIHWHACLVVDNADAHYMHY